MVPFRFPSGEPGIERIDDTPAGIADRARQGNLDVAIVSVTEVFDLEEQWEPLGPYGIATRSRAQSVILFSRRPIESLDGYPIYLTPASRTSVKLLSIICRQKYRHENLLFTHDPDRAEAWLWIGDEAIRRLRAESKPEFIYDLGEEWTEWQYLPFVFARWIIRRDLPESVKADFGYRLGRVLEANLKNLEALVQPYQHLMPVEEAVFYLRGFIYRFGPTEDKGLARFRDYLESIDHPAIPLSGVQS